MMDVQATTATGTCFAPVLAHSRLAAFPGTLQALCLPAEEAHADSTSFAVPTRLALAVLKPGWETSRDPSLAPVHSPVCLARVLHHEPLADGRRLLLVRGVCRAAVVNETWPEHGRRVVLVRRLTDVVPRVPAIDRFHRRAEILSLAARLVSPGAQEVLADVSRQSRPLGTLCDVVSHSLPLDRVDMLALLSTRNIDLRSDLLLAILRRQLRLCSWLPRVFPPAFGCN